MAVYLPLLATALAGTGLLAGSLSLTLALGAMGAAMLIAIRYGHLVSRAVASEDAEGLLLGVLGLTLVVAGLAASAHISAAIGAFLVGIAISGPIVETIAPLIAPLRDLFAAVFFVFFGLATDPRDIPPVLVPALILAFVTIVTKIITGYAAARRARIAKLGRWRSGFALVPRGEFSIVIAGLAVTAGIAPQLAPLSTAYVFITVIIGPLLARLPDAEFFKRWVRGRPSSPPPEIPLPPALTPPSSRPLAPPRHNKARPLR
jgi:CPA2 family monovalent cation:H+ antiporter-2